MTIHQDSAGKQMTEVMAEVKSLERLYNAMGALPSIGEAIIANHRILREVKGYDAFLAQNEVLDDLHRHRYFRYDLYDEFMDRVTGLLATAEFVVVDICDCCGKPTHDGADFCCVVAAIEAGETE